MLLTWPWALVKPSSGPANCTPLETSSSARAFTSFTVKEIWLIPNYYFEGMDLQSAAGQDWGEIYDYAKELR
jgi:hypothetical protein